jgi:hypothetical protein
MRHETPDNNIPCSQHVLAPGFRIPYTVRTADELRIALAVVLLRKADLSGMVDSWRVVC